MKATLERPYTHREKGLLVLFFHSYGGVEFICITIERRKKSS